MTSRLVFTVLAAALLSACGSDESAAPDSAPPPASSAQPAGTPPDPASASATAPATGTTAKPARSGGFGPHPSTSRKATSTGVVECDDFLAKYEACVADKVPEESRGAMQTALETWRGSWRTLAASPTTRGNLPQMCQAAADSARTQLTSYGCAL